MSELQTCDELWTMWPKTSLAIHVCTCACTLTHFHLPLLPLGHGFSIHIWLISNSKQSVHKILSSLREDGVWDSRPRKWQILMLQSQRWTWQCLAACKFQISLVVDSVLYIAQASYRDYISQEVQPICARHCTCTMSYSLIFKSQLRTAPFKALNYLVITLMNTKSKLLLVWKTWPHPQ